MPKSLVLLVCAVLLAAGVFATTRLRGADPKPATPSTPATPAVAPATQPGNTVDPKPVNSKCMVMTEEDIDPKVTVVYDGKTYAFCCEDCVKTFKKNPEKYTSGK